MFYGRAPLSTASATAVREAAGTTRRQGGGRAQPCPTSGGRSFAALFHQWQDGELLKPSLLNTREARRLVGLFPRSVKETGVSACAAAPKKHQGRRLFYKGMFFSSPSWPRRRAISPIESHFRFCKRHQLKRGAIPYNFASLFQPRGTAGGATVRGRHGDRGAVFFAAIRRRISIKIRHLFDRDAEMGPKCRFSAGSDRIGTEISFVRLVGSA